MTVTSLKIVDLVLDEEIQPRLRLDQRTIDAYVDLYKDGMELPPITVFQEGDYYYLADGFHRTQAATKAGLETLTAVVHQGTKRDTILYAIAANSTHPLALTADDKRRVVTRMLQDSEWNQWSDNGIAKHCGVAQSFVSKMRASLQSEISESRPRTYRTKHGTLAAMETSRIGRKTAPPVPAETATDTPDVPTTPAVLEAPPAALPDGSAIPVQAPVPLDVSSPPPEEYLPYFDLGKLVEKSIHVMGEIGAQLTILEEDYRSFTTAEGQPFPSLWALVTAPEPDGPGCDMIALLNSAATLVKRLEQLQTAADAILLPETPLKTVPARDLTFIERVRNLLPQLPDKFARQDVARRTGMTGKQAGRALRSLVEDGEIRKVEDGYAKTKQRGSSKSTRGPSKS